jgi:hypothetical protein
MPRVALHHRHGQGWDRPDPRVDPAQFRLPVSAQWLRNKTRDKEHLMLDVFMLVLGLGFFAAAVGYTYACERL